jgi:hypothetical protein
LSGNAGRLLATSVSTSSSSTRRSSAVSATTAPPRRRCRSPSHRSGPALRRARGRQSAACARAPSRRGGAVLLVELRIARDRLVIAAPKRPDERQRREYGISARIFSSDGCVPVRASLVMMSAMASPTPGIVIASAICSWANTCSRREPGLHRSATERSLIGELQMLAVSVPRLRGQAQGCFLRLAL